MDRDDAVALIRSNQAGYEQDGTGLWSSGAWKRVVRRKPVERLPQTVDEAPEKTPPALREALAGNDYATEAGSHVANGGVRSRTGRDLSPFIHACDMPSTKVAQRNGIPCGVETGGTRARAATGACSCARMRLGAEGLLGALPSLSTSTRLHPEPECAAFAHGGLRRRPAALDHKE